MKTLDEIKVIKNKFSEEYRDSFTAVGNNLSIGIGKDATSGDFTIEARLTNDKLKSALPDAYHGVKVNVKIIGIIRPL